MASKKKNSPASYNDVRYVMDMALKRPGLIYETSTAGKAIHFKQRCYSYRNLLREMTQEQVQNVPGYRAETAYDILVIRQTNEEKEPDRQGRFLIFDHEAPSGKLIDPETGEEIDMTDFSFPIIDRS